MSRGKKLSTEEIYRVMASWAVTDNYAETARQVNIPASTVEKVVKDNKDKDEFVELCLQKRRQFAETAADIIDKGLALLNVRFNRALMQEKEIEKLIGIVEEESPTKISYPERTAIIAKLKSLQLYDIKALTTAIAVLYDKRALAEGKATSNTEIVIKLPEGIEEYAG